MKQKYAITKNTDAGQMTIQEFAELDKDVFSLVCEESYDSEKIRAAAEEGREPLVEVLRTPNLYPVSEYAEKLADSVKELFAQAEAQSVEIEFDDIETLNKEKKPAEEEEDEDAVALDDLLEDREEEDALDEADADSEDSEDENNNAPLSDEEGLDVFDDDDDENEDDL